MGAPTWDRVKAVFADANELPGDQRAAYLDSTCGDDRELRVQVEALLLAHDEAGEFLSEPTQHKPTHDLTKSIDTKQLAERLGTKIDRYKLLQRIGPSQRNYF